MQVQELLLAWRSALEKKIEALPSSERQVVMGRNHPWHHALVCLDTLLLQANLLFSDRSILIVKECWAPVRKVGVELGLFEAFRGNEEAKKCLRAFLNDFPRRDQKGKRKVAPIANYYEQVAGVLMPSAVTKLVEEALLPKTLANATDAEIKRARERLR